MTHLCKVIAIVGILLAMASCKKGEEDPAVTFRTRKARLAGEWRLKSGRAAATTGIYNETYTFGNSKMTINVTSPNYPVVYTGAYLLNLTISKDGTFTMNEVFAARQLKAEGTWNFNSGVGEAKKKQKAIFFISKVINGHTSGGIFNRRSTNFVYDLVELRNKELMIHSASKVYSEGGEYIDFMSEYTFIQ